jgi:murein DD-endopeptidase MepM/ murein hydrolase activator NlpD
MIRTIIISILISCFCTNLYAKPFELFPEDSLYFHPNPIATKQKNVIETMNKEQLASLVDSLFQMDTMPLNLLNEIKLEMAKLRDYEKNKHGLTYLNSAAVPSSEFYSSWEINKLFPEKDMLKMKGDSSVTLDLTTDGNDDYHHPFNGIVTSDFGWRDSAQHNGVDIKLNRGDNVEAAFDGMVRYANNAYGYGNVVIIRHYNGLETVYGHLSKIKVKPGQVILAGQVIGLGGSTGSSTAPHLHFEIRFKGVPINPKYLISYSEQKLVCTKLVIKQTRWGVAAYPEIEKQYTIEKGDTIFEIAKHFGTSPKSIKELNGFSNSWVKLKAGQIINVLQ